MLNSLRKDNIRKPLWLALSAVLIVSFGFFGASTFFAGGGSSSYIGKVNGKNISGTDFRKALLSTRDQAILMHGDNYFKIEHLLNLESDAWDRIILLQEAKRRKIAINDQEVVHFIESLPFFQRNGQFDGALYTNVLKFVFKRNPRDFEEGVRENLIIKKLFDLESGAMAISEEEILKEFENRNKSVQVSYVLFPSVNYVKNTSVTDEEAEAYYDANKEDFRISDSINVAYINIPFADDASVEDKQKAKAKAQEIYSGIKDSKDLERAAEANDLKIAETGLFTAEQPDFGVGWSYELLQEILSLPEGSVTKPEETTNGYKIFKIVEKKAGYVPEFKEAKAKAVAAISEQKSTEWSLKDAQANHEKIQPLLAEGKDFAAAAEELNLDPEETPFFTKGQYLPNIGLSNDFQEAAFSLTPEQKLSDVIATPKGYAFLYFQESKIADNVDYEKEKDRIASDLMNAKLHEKLSDFVARMRAKANLQINTRTQ